ncbi:hypothetical protein JDV09_19900 [Mycobacterium sp. Y57]|uniref:hypothetical protein n=1 Tax=Mycolicibacterium xanthum TaxID=2796469 RepID=UPI001C864393|nr:hypothetical protein [Mycolicibacterium xanthum]MBX7434343.1 hypothetical protein [Mycolicibacterium xanthum]
MDSTPDRPLRRISLDPGHWRQVRRLLFAEAVVLALVGIGGLAAYTFAGPLRIGAGALELTPALSVAMLLVALAAAVAATRRTLAGWFSAAVAVGGLVLVIVSAVAATHSAPGPFGFTDATVLIYAAAFVFHFALGVWLIPDHIEGPEWVPAGLAAVSERRGRA